MIIMIPLQLSVCITEELFAKYLYYYPDTGMQSNNFSTLTDDVLRVILRLGHTCIHMNLLTM